MVHSAYQYYIEDRKYIPCLLSVVMINPQWLELPMSRTNLHGPKDVRVIEVFLCMKYASSVHAKKSPKLTLY